MKENKIIVIGLGYVGLPLSLEFGKKFPTFGFDFSRKILSLKKQKYSIKETHKNPFKKSKYLKFTSDASYISKCNIIIITVPTPINKANNPDLSLLKNACKLVSCNLNKESIIIFESTVYPGLTEEICVPILEKHSKLKWKKDFNVGYSPERINPGDNKHTLTKIMKVVSGDTKKSLKIISRLYKSIISAGIFEASSIKVAEAAKVIENTQRDLNIALMNELAIIFKKLNINSNEVFRAARSKWNFLDFVPGLVGGHCIGVDPYYLTYKSRMTGYDPKIILSGRKVNDHMGKYVAKELLKKIKKNNVNYMKIKILIMGMTFKEDFEDFRNSRVIDIYKELIKSKCLVDIYDPIVNKEEVIQKHKIKIINKIRNNYYDGIIISVAHKVFLKMGITEIRKFAKKTGIIFDVKSIFANKADLRL